MLNEHEKHKIKHTQNFFLFTVLGEHFTNLQNCDF